MLNGEMGRYRVDDMVRVGETRRSTKAIARRRAEIRGKRARTLVTTAVTLLPFGGKH